MAKTALGKGLGALISAPSSVSGISRLPALAQPAPGDVVNRVTLDQIVPSPLQPRKEFQPEQLTELMESIREHGIIQPLIVRRVNGKLELIAGERRFRASRELGLKEIPVIVREASDKDVLEMALIENLQREGLNPIEEAQAYSRLAKDFHMRQEDIAQRVGKNRATVANTMRLLDLPWAFVTCSPARSFPPATPRCCSCSKSRRAGTRRPADHQQRTHRPRHGKGD
jgi:ParB family chromosome partitioning protein